MGALHVSVLKRIWGKGTGMTALFYLLENTSALQEVSNIPPKDGVTYEVEEEGITLHPHDFM